MTYFFRPILHLSDLAILNKLASQAHDTIGAMSKAHHDTMFTLKRRRGTCILCFANPETFPRKKLCYTTDISRRLFRLSSLENPESTLTRRISLPRELCPSFFVNLFALLHVVSLTV
jgi:hypothetical protein